MQANTLEHETGSLVAGHLEQAQGVLAVAKVFVIDCPELAREAAEDLTAIKGKMKALMELRLSITRPLDESKRRIMGLFDEPLALLQQAEELYKGSVLAWKEAERKRIFAEQQAALEASRVTIDALAEREKQNQAMLDTQCQSVEILAQQARAEGDEQTAEHLQQQVAELKEEAQISAAMTAEQIQEQQALPPVVVESVKLAGISERRDFKAEVVDLAALVSAVAAGKASLQLLEPNHKEIARRARTLKLEFQVPGVRVFAVDRISSRAK